MSGYCCGIAPNGIGSRCTGTSRGSAESSSSSSLHKQENYFFIHFFFHHCKSKRVNQQKKIINYLIALPLSQKIAIRSPVTRFFGSLLKLNPNGVIFGALSTNSSARRRSITQFMRDLQFNDNKNKKLRKGPQIKKNAIKRD